MTEPTDEQHAQPPGQEAPAPEPISIFRLCLLGLVPSLLHVVVLLVDPWGRHVLSVVYAVFMPLFALAWLLLLQSRLLRRSPTQSVGCGAILALLFLNCVFWVGGCAMLTKLNIH
jgi:hypothetical protein